MTDDTVVGDRWLSSPPRPSRRSSLYREARTLAVPFSYAAQTSMGAVGAALPALSGVTAGQLIIVRDANNMAATNPITITASGSDEIVYLGKPIERRMRRIASDVVNPQVTVRLATCGQT